MNGACAAVERYMEGGGGGGGSRQRGGDGTNKKKRPRAHGPKGREIGLSQT